MSKLNKVSRIIITLLIMFSMFFTIVYADDGNFDVDAFEGVGEGKLTNAKGYINNTAATVISAMRIICVTIAIVILLVIAIKYMMSAPGDRADIKKHAVHYVISAAILFGVTGILTIINNFATAIGAE